MPIFKTYFYAITISLITLLCLIPCCSKDTNVPNDNGYTGISEVLDPYEQNKLLGRSVNLGNALEAPNEGEWGVTLKQEYSQLIK